MDDIYKGFLWGVLTMLIIVLAGIGVFLVFFNDNSARNGYPSLAYAEETKEELREGYDAFQVQEKNIVEILDRHYYEDLDLQDMYDGAYKGMVDAIADPYTHYYTAEEMSQVFSNGEGEFVGIGCGLGQMKDSKELVVLYTYEDSPCEKAGLKMGDIIIAVDGQNIVGMDIDMATTYIQGDEGTPVKLTVKRDDELLDFEMVRAKIAYKMVSYRMLEDGIGYIYVLQFYMHTAEQFSAALKDLEDQGMTKLIIDLREDPGGYYEICLEMLDRMLEKGLVASYTEDKEGRKEKEYTKDDEAFDKPTVILINGNTASSAELFTQTMSDYEKATVIGTTSYGKGIYQDYYKIGNEGAGIKLTGGRFFSGKGVCVHGVGIKPDIEVELDPEYETIAPFKRENDNQIQAAIDFLKN